jgi:hypothetical protein
MLRARLPGKGVVQPRGKLSPDHDAAGTKMVRSEGRGLETPPKARVSPARGLRALRQLGLLAASAANARIVDLRARRVGLINLDARPSSVGTVTSSRRNATVIKAVTDPSITDSRSDAVDVARVRRLASSRVWRFWRHPCRCLKCPTCSENEEACFRNDGPGHEAGKAMSPKLTVWYNTKCPVCNAGIAWQRNRLVRAARAGAIAFRDRRRPPIRGRRLRDRDLAQNPGRRRLQDGDVGFGKAAKDELDCRSASSIRS